MWVYLIVAAILLYALHKERQQLGCPAFPDTNDCRNEDGKVLRGTKSDASDDEATIFGNIKTAADFASQWVIWRMAILLSSLATVLGFFLVYQRIPTEFELVGFMLVFTFCIYFMFGFYKFHMLDYVRKNIDESVDILQTREQNPFVAG